MPRGRLHWALGETPVAEVERMLDHHAARHGGVVDGDCSTCILFAARLGLDLRRRT